MNRIFNVKVIAFALSLAGATAFAQGINGPVTRGQVQAELATANANRALKFYEDVAYAQPHRLIAPVPASAVTAQVHDDGRRAAVTPSAGGLTREQVKAELAAARASGELNPFDNMDGITYRPAMRATVAPPTLAQSR